MSRLEALIDELCPNGVGFNGFVSIARKLQSQL